MPLHVARLRDSDLAAEGHPEGCWYAVLLWSASWHQLPAGSLPNNDAVLARLCGLGRDVRTFRKRRDDALRGFVLCSDGRLYHPVVAEQVVSAWQGKLEQRWRTECARIKKANQRNGTDLPSPTLEDFLSSYCKADVPALSLGTEPPVPEDEASKRKGQGERQGKGDLGSEAEASGVEPPKPPAPIDLQAAIFNSGLPLLMASGLKREQAAKLLGKWKRENGNGAVLDALAHAQAEGTPDPVSLITAILGTRNGKRTHHDREDPIFAARRNLGIDDQPGMGLT